MKILYEIVYDFNINIEKNNYFKLNLTNFI